MPCIADVQAENMSLSNQISELETKQEEISAMKLHFLGMSSSQVFECLQTSAVCWAAFLGDINSLQMLLDNGVDILRQNYDGRTALHLAVSGGQVECIRFLFGVGAQMVADNSGHTPLQQAIQEGRQDLAMELNALLCEQQKRSIDAMYADSFDYFDGKNLTRTAPVKKERKHRRDRSDPIKDEPKPKKFPRSAPRETDQFGVRRGSCMVPDCDCKRYTEKAAEDKVTICTCAHFPASHKFLSKVEAMSTYGLQEIESVNHTFAANSLIKWDANQLELWPRKFNLEITPLSMEFQIKFQKFIESSDLTNVGALDVKFWSSLGSGSSAEVFKGMVFGGDINSILAEWKNVPVALKVILFSNAALKTESVVDEFQHELDVLSKIKHPNCLECFGVISRPRICFVLEYCEKGSMYDILTKSIYKLDWTNLLRWFINVLEGLSYLHNFQPCVLHRDIKSKNLLIDADDNVKLADFGTARFLIQGESEVSLGALRGTYSYTAPELYFGVPFTVESDIYSLGVLLWELVHKCITGDYLLPYNEYAFIVHDFQIIILSAKRNIRPTIPDSTPLQIKKIIKHLWNARPEKRPRLAKLRSYFDLLYEHLKKKTEGEFSNFFDDAKSFEISSTRMQSHEAEGGPASGEASVPFQLIDDDDLPLGRAFEDLVHFDERHFASQQHRITSRDFENYFNPTPPTPIIDAQPDGKNATISDFMTNSSSTTPTDMWSSSLPLHASAGQREDDSGKMGTSSGEMMPIFAGDIELIPKNKRSSSTSSISDTDSISPYSSNDRLRLETKLPSGFSPKGGKKKTKQKFSPDEQPEKEPSPTAHSKTHAYQKRYDSGGDKHKDKRGGGSSYRGQRTESKSKIAAHEKNEG